ncbi:MAG: hypothetical protein R6U70_08915 [Bacillota bacterium]
MASRRRPLPGVNRAHYWALGAVLAAALLLLRLELDQLWPASPIWVRSLLAFGLTAAIGELWVARYWPLLRGTATEAREVALEFSLLVMVLTAVLVLLEVVADIILPVGPVAWICYMSYVLMDASYQW